MTPPIRYSAVAIVLHWAIAFAILFNIPLGLWMHSHAEHNDISEAVFRAFQLHKSIGLTVLALSFVRLGWRLANPPPALPEHMPAWERIVAKATHWAFYVLMIALPLTGWLYVSAGWSAHTDQPLNVPTRYFGLFHVPDLFGLSHADTATRSSTAHLSLSTHGLLGWAMLGLAALHTAAALKHQFFDRDAVLAHMVPGIRAPGAQPEAAGGNPARSAILGLGLGATTLLGAIALYTVFTYPTAPQPAQTASTFETVDTSTPTPPPVSSPPTQSPTAETTATPPAPAAASTWTVNSSASSVGFSFVYRDPENGDTTFNGRFTRWHANIRFDANDLPHSSAVVVIETGSATDGVEIHDRGLPAPEWFDATGHPTAEFRTTSIRRRGDGYEAAGQLTIKGHMKAVTLPFTLAIDGNHASMRGTLAIDRGDFDIGVHSDANDMISQTVNISIRVDATRGS